VTAATTLTALQVRTPGAIVSLSLSLSQSSLPYSTRRPVVFTSQHLC
jgi:hypothetical protein